MEMRDGRFLRKSAALDFSAVTDTPAEHESVDELEDALAFVQAAHLLPTDQGLFNQHTLFLSNLKNLQTLGGEAQHLNFVKHLFGQVQMESRLEWPGGL